MRKPLKSIMSMVLAGAMVCSMAACGGSGSGAAEGTTAAATPTAAVSDGGKVLNIWCWNDEFQSRFNAYYPEVKEIAEDKSTTTLNDGTVVKWTINPNENNNYQNKLDEALLNQETAADDDKIDIFLIEADYALKYVDSAYTVNVDDLGLTEDEMADQYQYTKDIVTDSNGAIKGTTWQATPGLFA
ncbi:MAG: carbohydrate ABC transporter substrate-binding protein, partial [Eubacterium sp.]|nr:carbohydrate ABC transporter substrate-binding protein [Eubacterium sp.]